MTKKLFLLITVLANLNLISSEKNFDIQNFIRQEIEKELRRNIPATQIPIHNHIYTSSTAQNQSNPSIQTMENNKAKEENPYLQSVEKTLLSLFEQKNKFKVSLIEYKWIIASSCLASFYLYIYNQIYQINKLLDDASSWHLFKEEIPLSRLKTINRNDLFKELQLAVCKKYISPCQPDSSQKVMIKFLEEISLEKAALEKYLQYQQIITCCYTSKIFPTLKKTEHIEEAIARINFLIDLYIEFFVIK